jgi:hypothetical protein
VGRIEIEGISKQGAGDLFFSSFNDVASSSDYMASNDKKISKQCIGRDMEGNDSSKSLR